MRTSEYFDDEVDLHCTETDKTVRAEVIDFANKEWLTVSVQRSVKIHLQYYEQHEVYIGTSAGLEFQSKGPARIA
jgi:hypothetical protein